MCSRRDTTFGELTAATITAEAPELAAQCANVWAAAQEGIIKPAVVEDSQCRALGHGTFASQARALNATWMTVGGLHVPKFNVTFLRRFGDVYHYRRLLEPSNSPLYRLPTHVELVRKHDLADVVVLNFGLHAGNESAYRDVTATALDDLERFGRLPGKLAVYRETSSQHVPAPGGDYLVIARFSLVRAPAPSSNTGNGRGS